MLRRLSLLIAVAALAAACSGGDEPVETTATTLAFTDPALEQFEWLLEASQTGGLGADVLEERISPDLLDAIGGLGLIEGLVELGLTTEEWEVVESEFGLFEGVAVLRNADGDRIQLLVATKSIPPYRIDQLRATPLSPEFDDGLTEEAVDGRIQALGDANWGLFEVNGRSCVPLVGTEVDEVGPIAGAFDLWVLAALAEAIDAGEARFTETLPVSDDLKSSLDGQVGVAADGTFLPLSRYAELMVSIQDNSATDHLIDRLGREAVEQAMINAGVAMPELNQPLLNTREFFVLKFRAQREPVDDYLALDAAGRRAYLETELAGVSILEAGLDGPRWNAPTLIDEVEWFASPADLCRSHAYLADLATRPGLDGISAILGLNPGVPLDEETWTAFQFKSGTEFGVFTAAWYLVREDGRIFVVAGTVSDAEQIVDEAEAIALFQAIIDLAAAA